MRKETLRGTGVGSSREQSERGGRLPEPELNPMMNPKLGQNLGRWAQVYFTAPPEKRKEAVEGLLRELEDEDPDYVPPSIVTKTVECPECHERNEAGHRFCGMCGADLNGAGTLTPENRIPKETERAASAPQVQEHEAFRPVPPAPVVERRIAPLPADVERELYRVPRVERRTAPVPVERVEDRVEYHPAPSAAPPQQVDDVQWLRERALVGLTEDDSRGSGFGKYILVAVLVIGAAFAGLEWASREPPKTVEVVQGTKPKTDITPPQVNQQAPTPPADAQPVAEQKPPTKPQQSPATEKTAAQSSAPEQTPSTPRIERASAAPPRPTAETPAPDTDTSGIQELTMAERYLQGRYGSRSTSEAARWLWKSVAKQNTTASVLLANLYMQGDGVPKSCDQARLLLAAAARKGSSTAAQNLRNLQSGGCK
ncbi:MAG TPA: hypothetical protein VFA68_16225 [Terriglobales bacterium]|nr:hypothetical protein [Terriglobales bacterium]